VEVFSSTQWSTVLRAGGESSHEARQALEKLCNTYWYPLYAYVRRQGHAPADAQDLTQDFFARFLERKYVRLATPERGRFRTFLLTSLKNFLVNEWNKSNALKRGGGQQIISLDEEVAEERFAAEPASQPPDALFDHRWATTLLDRALTRLREEAADGGKSGFFDQVQAFVWGGQETEGYAQAAERLAMTEGALRVAVHRLRQRFGELLRAEVAHTVATPAEVEEELRYLIAVVRAVNTSGP
jgi:RNA polymerase sigma factor (sigma-70 family)